MPKVNLLKDVDNSEEVIDMVDKMFHLSTNVSAMEVVVEKIAKTKLTATLDEVYFKFLEWKHVKETRRSDVGVVEDRLLTHLLENDQAQSEDSLEDPEDINLDGYRFLFIIVFHILFNASN